MSSPERITEPRVVVSSPNLRSVGASAGGWKTKGACFDSDSMIFFKKDRGGPTYEDARAICHSCRVVDACLDFAVRNHQNDGMWGGLTPRERRALRRPTRSTRTMILHVLDATWQETVDLANACAINSTTCRNALYELEKDGLVERAPRKRSHDNLQWRLT